MTNYNERLDEALFYLTDQSAWDLIGITQEQANELTAQLIVDRHEAKQALTSLKALLKLTLDLHREKIL